MDGYTVLQMVPVQNVPPYALDTAVIYSTCGYVWLLVVTLGLHLVTTGYIRLPYRLISHCL